MMKLQNVLLTLLCGVCCLPALALEPIADKFITMPASLLPTIETVHRMDLVDFYHAKQTASVTNGLGGTSTLTQLQESLLSIDLSAHSRLEMQLCAYKKDTLIAVINTVCAPACDSHIRFYTTDWKKRPVLKHIRFVKLDEFLQFPDTLPQAEQGELRNLVNIRLLEYSFTPTGDLLVSPSWEEYLDEESFKRIQPYLRDNIILHWNGKKFE